MLAGGGGDGRHRGLAAEECHHTLDVILHGRLRDGGGDFAATLYLLLRHYPDQVLAVVEREAACTARRAARVAAHLGTKSRVLAWRLARRAQEQLLRPFVERLLAGAGRRVAGVVEARQLVRVLGERGAFERALLFRALLGPKLLVQACRAVRTTGSAWGVGGGGRAVAVALGVCGLGWAVLRLTCVLGLVLAVLLGPRAGALEHHLGMVLQHHLVEPLVHHLALARRCPHALERR